MDSCPDTYRPDLPQRRSAGSVAAAGPGTSIFSSGLEAASDKGLALLAKDAELGASIEAVEIAAKSPLRHQRQLPDRSRLGRGRIWRTMGLRGTPRPAAGRIHHPHAPAGNRILSGTRPSYRRPAMVKFRHAPPSVGAAPRCIALFRTVRRNLAALHSQHLRRKDPAGLDPPGPSHADPLHRPHPVAHPAHDETPRVPSGASRFPARLCRPASLRHLISRVRSGWFLDVLSKSVSIKSRAPTRRFTPADRVAPSRTAKEIST